MNQHKRTRIRLLLIENSAADAALIVRRLSQGGYEVDYRRVEADESVPAAFDSGPWDLIICDYSLPHFSGDDPLKTWRQKGFKTPFIFISGRVGETGAVEALKEGASDYILKDNLTRLVPAVDRTLREVRELEEREQEHRNAEESMRLSDARYRALIEHSQDVILVLDRDYRIVFCSSGLKGILGSEPSNYLGRSFLDLVDLEDREVASHELRNCLPPISTTHRLRVRHVHRSYCVADCVFSNLLDKPPVDGMVINLTDVTEKALAEEALKKSEEKFSKAFRSCPLAVTITTLHEGRYLDVNDAFLTIFGYSRLEVIGRNSTDLRVWTSIDQRAEFLGQLRGSSAKVTGFRAVFRAKNDDLREAIVAAEPIELDGTPCVLAVTQDVTETNHLEAQFRHAQKMEAVGQLAGGVAHDFNNLLMVIRSYAQLIESEVSEPAALEYANRIIEASDKAAAVTRQLLAFSRRQPQELKKIDLGSLVRDFCAILPRLIGEDVQIKVSSTSVGLINADRGQLEQVIMNLAVNARDAMPSGGTLTIQTADVDLGESASFTHGAQIPAGQYVVLAVTDSGSGMSEDTKARIFEPFFTTKEDGKGTGLGLATVYGIVKQHVGFVWVYSEIGLGTTFKVYLPRWLGTPVPKEVRQPISKKRIEGSQTILIVEDKAVLLEVMSKYLTSKGYRILEARDGPEALQLASRYHQPIHLLLTDVVMPKMRGPEVDQRIRSIHPETMTVFMSGYSDLSAEGIGTAVVLQKPIDLDLLAQKVHRLFSGHESMND